MLHKNASITSIPRRRYRPPCSRVRVRIRVRVEVRFSVSASSIDLHDNDRGSETGAKRRALPFFLGEDLMMDASHGRPADNRKSGKSKNHFHNHDEGIETRHVVYDRAASHAYQ